MLKQERDLDPEQGSPCQAEASSSLSSSFDASAGAQDRPGSEIILRRRYADRGYYLLLAGFVARMGEGIVCRRGLFFVLLRTRCVDMSFANLIVVELPGKGLYGTTGEALGDAGENMWVLA